MTVISAGMEKCCRLENYRYTLYTTFQEPKLFRMAARGDWDRIPDRAKSHPKEAAFVHRYAPMDTALHRILRPIITCNSNSSSGSNSSTTTTTTNTTSAAEPPPHHQQQQNIATDSTNSSGFLDDETQYEMKVMKLKAVAALLEANRQATLIPDSFGRTPLHLACMDVATNITGVDTAAAPRSSNTGSSLHGGAEAALMIIDAIKDGATACAPDMEGRTPLHYLVARNQLELDHVNNNDNNNLHMELLTRLVALWPSALFWKDVVGETPLDIVASRREEWARADHVLDILLQLQRQQMQPQEQQQSVTKQSRKTPSANI